MNLKEDLEQNNIIDAVYGNYIVCAGPGSGKTTTLVRRVRHMIEDLKINQDSILIMTFGKEASENVKEKLKKISKNLNPQIMTLHALALSITRSYNPKYQVWENEFDTENRKGRRKVLESVAKEVLSDTKKIALGQINDFIDIQKLNMIHPGEKTLYDGYDFQYSHSVLDEIFDKYERYKENHYLLEFRDFLGKAIDILEKHPEEKEKIQKKYDFFMVDEAQDLDYAQYKMIMLLSEFGNIMMVGDIMQGIFGFRGGSPDFMEDFTLRKKAEVLHLTSNYRSNSSIINNANHFAKETESSCSDLYHNMKIINKQKLQPIFKTVVSKDDEVRMVASEIKALHAQGVSYNDMAVIGRVNYLLYDYEDYFSLCDIPFEPSSHRLFQDKPEVKTFLDYINFLKNPDNDNVFMKIYNTPNRFLGKSFIYKLDSLGEGSYYSKIKFIPTYGKRGKDYLMKKNAEKILLLVSDFKREFGNVESANPFYVIKWLNKKLEIMESITKEMPRENKHECVQMQNYNRFLEISQKFRRIEELEKYLSNISSKAKEVTSQKELVKIKTMHGSKGLEWNTCFVTGVTPSIMPCDKDGCDKEEEYRLMYVAITRAKERLYIHGYKDKEGNQSEIWSMLEQKEEEK